MGEIVIPTNCIALDELLGGGLRTGTLLLAYGEAETGKTTLALQLAINCSAIGHKALFVDCEGSLRPEKIRAMAADDPEVLENLTIARPRSFEEQAELIECLPDFASAGLTLVAVDTMTGLYRLKLSELVVEATEGEEGDEEARKKIREMTFALNRELNRQAAMLAQVAHEYDVAVVMTSQVRARPTAEEDAVEPVASRILRFWAEVVLRLRLTGRPGLRMAVLEKGPDPGLVGSMRLFKLTDEGIVDAL